MRAKSRRLFSCIRHRCLVEPGDLREPYPALALFLHRQLGADVNAAREVRFGMSLPEEPRNLSGGAKEAFNLPVGI